MFLNILEIIGLILAYGFIATTVATSSIAAMREEWTA